MMPVTVRCIQSINDFRVSPIGDVFMLRRSRPIVEATSTQGMRALHLLQKHEIRIDAMQALAQLVDDQATVKRREPFMNIVRRDGQ